MKELLSLLMEHQVRLIFWINLYHILHKQQLLGRKYYHKQDNTCPVVDTRVVGMQVEVVAGTQAVDTQVVVVADIPAVDIQVEVVAGTQVVDIQVEVVLDIQIVAPPVDMSLVSENYFQLHFALVDDNKHKPQLTHYSFAFDNVDKS